VKLAALLLVVTLSFLVFTQTQPTAFNWPSIDMAPYLERQADSNFVPNDFFTNASSQPNPRHIFGFSIVFLTDIFDTEWYTVFYFLLVFFSLTIIPLFFLTIIAAFRTKITDDRRYILAIILTALLVSTVFMSKILALFSIGWWSPLMTGPMTQTLSLFIGLIFCWLALSQQRKYEYYFLPLLFFATLVHPAIGLFVFLFFLALDSYTPRFKYYLISLFGSIGGAFVTLAILFPPQTKHNAQDFIYYYIIENHSFHYLISDLASFTAIPWYVSFVMILGIFSTAFFFGYYVKDRYLQYLSLISFLLYSGVVLAQYVFIELLPLKIVAIIGPVRFSMFGFWLALVLLVYICAQYAPRGLVPALSQITFPKYRSALAICGTVFICFFIIALSYKDNPQQSFESQYLNLMTWVSKNTQPEDVFAVFPNFPPTHVPLILKRGVFYGNGFPFTEDGFAEHTARKELIYGLQTQVESLPGQQPWEKTISFYRSLVPEDFIRASQSFRLDYVIIESEYADKFINFQPLFSNDGIYLYSVNSF
jgi:hypothetical protein